MVWYGMVWYGMVWYGMVWYGIGMVWYSIVYGMVWYGMVWYSIWYGMVWYGMVWYGIQNQRNFYPSIIMYFKELLIISLIFFIGNITAPFRPDQIFGRTKSSTGPDQILGYYNNNYKIIGYYNYNYYNYIGVRNNTCN